MLGAATPDGVCLLEFLDRKALPGELASVERSYGALGTGKNPHLDALGAQLEAYFGGERRDFTVPLVTAGTVFERAVWERLRLIPYGRTTSYGRLARDMGREGAQRAVGRANGHNRIAIVIPCHRVIDSDGNLHGYGGGIVRKRYLLELESSVAGFDGCGTLWGRREPAMA